MKTTIILYASLVATLLAALTSCRREFDFEYNDINPITVIEAELTPDGTRIGITLTTPMDEPMDRTRLTDATVTLADMTDGTELTLAPDEAGYYTGAEGIAGHEYKLTVAREECSYEAATVLYPGTEIVSLEFNWIKMPYDHVAVLQCRFRDISPAAGDCYWVKLYRNGEIYSWTELDDRGTVDGLCTFFTMTSRRDTDAEDDSDVLYDGDVVTCTVSPISRAMHDYLEALQNDSSGPRMFEGDFCLGYFMATTTVSASIVFHPDEIPFYQ